MVKVQIDEAQLLRSLKRAAKVFGDDSAQATIRWGVSTARELAKSTQAFGDGGKPEKMQRGAILKDMRNTLTVTTRKGAEDNPKRVFEFMDGQHGRNTKRTKKMPPDMKLRITKEAFAAVIREKMKRAGMAKGGWIGAGNELARHQTGSGKFTIGAGFIRYAQKHSAFGKARAARSGFHPQSIITNSVRHSAWRRVMTDRRANSAIWWGLKKTIKWYEKAATKSLSKK
jgi:hypothetical protein